MVKITVSKKHLSKSAVYQPTFSVDGEPPANWPQVKGWTITGGYQFDTFGHADEVDYQHDDTIKTVTFNGEKLSVNKGPGIWYIEDFGQRIKGTWKSLDDIPSVLKTIPAKVATIHKKVLSTVPRFKDWDRTVDMGDGTVTYLRSGSADVSASVTVYLDDILTDGKGEVALTISDDGGYQQATLVDKTFTIKSVSEIKDILEVSDAIMKTQIP